MMRGQATVAVLIALALGGALALLVAERARLAVERAHAQRVADAAALAAASGAARPRGARAAADRAARPRGGARIVAASSRSARVRVVVRLRPRRARAAGAARRRRRRRGRRRRPPRRRAIRSAGSVAVPAAVRRRWSRDAARREGVPGGPAGGAAPGRVGLRSRAPSRRAGAQGIAQFMPGTWAGVVEPVAGGEPVRRAGRHRRAGAADGRAAARRSAATSRARAGGLQRRPGPGPAAGRVVAGRDPRVRAGRARAWPVPAWGVRGSCADYDASHDGRRGDPRARPRAARRAGRLPVPRRRRRACCTSARRSR